MEIENDEESTIPETRNDSENLEKSQTIESDLTDKTLESTTIIKEEKDESDQELKAENSNNIVEKNSFKVPALLIGPRRGKPGQLRSIGSPISKEVSEQPLIIPEKIVKEDDTKNTEKIKNVEKVKNTNNEKTQIPLQYKEPTWSGTPEAAYKIEVLKSGMILETIDLSKKSFHVVGRLLTCDISLAHPTISRYHAIFQYRCTEDDKNPSGFYLYDLGSTHGTFWNGCRIRPNTYVRLQGGHMIRFGCSQRKFIIETPPEDMEEESALTVTELKQQRQLLLLERERLAKEEKEKAEEEERLRLEKEAEEGIDWGMGEDANEETDMAENPYASTNNEELFLDDPKKTLRGWFEREGHELQYQTEEKGIGQFLCWVELPLDGRIVRAEALVKGKKKESVVQCALEACRVLDRHGVLRQATHEARKRKTRNWEEEDYYDSDEDNFLDRTGTIEKKREQRMRQAGKLDEKVETYSSLLEKHTAVIKKIDNIESQLQKAQKLKDEAAITSNEDDALDAYMSSLNSNVYNKTDVKKMKLELQNLKKEEERLLKLVNITKPANLPSLTSRKTDEKQVPQSTETKNKSTVTKKRTIHCESENKKSSPPTKKYIPQEKVEKDAIERTAVDSDPGNLVNNETKIVEEPEVRNTRNEDDSNVHLPISESTEKNETEQAKKKMKNMKRMQQRAEKAEKEFPKNYDGETYSEDYSMWLPPENQSGDGKTSLNERYGY